MNDHAITISDETLQMLLKIETAEDDIESLVKLSNVDPSDFSKFLKDTGIEHDENAQKLLAVSKSIYSPPIIELARAFELAYVPTQTQQFIIEEPRSEEFLVKVYRNANNIFSTHTKSDSALWSEQLEKRIIEVSKESGTEVTRIFLFDEKRNIKDGDFQEMKYEYDNNIDVKIYIIGEHKQNIISPTTPLDFTMDNENGIIAVSNSFGGDEYSTTWYFNNPDTISRFQNLQRRLITGSKEFNKFRF